MIDWAADAHRVTVPPAGSRRALGAALALALAAAGLAGGAAAQQGPVGAPLRLTPPGATQQPPPPPLPVERATPDRPLTGAPPGAIRPAQPGGPVDVAPLAAADPDGIGIRAAAADPFGLELWARTPRDVATVLVTRLPAGSPSATLRDLQKRLLQAATKVPDGNPPAGAPRLIALRIAKLAEMGEIEAAEALLKLVPASLEDEAIARLRVEQAFLTDRRDEGCTQVQRQLAGKASAVFWQQAQIACQVAAGQEAQAGLSAQLLREQGFDNAVFFTLVDLATGGRGGPLDKLGPVSPVMVPLLRAAKKDVPADPLAASAPGVLRALALAPELPLATRLAAGERAAALGALPPDGLAALYAAMEFPPAEVANAAAVAKSDRTARARALLHRAIQAQPTPVMRAELIRAAFEQARPAGLLLATAALYRASIEQIPPSAELVWFAGDAARALLAAGALDQARRWYELVRSRGNADSEASKLTSQLWALFRIAGVDDGPVDAARLLSWYDAQAARPSPTQAERAVTIYGLLSALGERVPPGAWIPMLVAGLETQRPTPGTPALLELGAAATDQRLGEAIASAMLAIGSREPAAAGVLACTGVTGALRALGLAQAARRFAVEAALSAGA